MRNIQESPFFSQKWPKMAKICKKIIFLKTGCRVNLYPLMLLFALFWGKKAFLQKNDNNIFSVLWYSIFMQKNIKNGWMVQKIVIWKKMIFQILPNFAPIFRGKGVEIEKIVLINLKVHFNSYSNIKSDFQNL